MQRIGPITMLALLGASLAVAACNGSGKDSGSGPGTDGGATDGGSDGGDGGASHDPNWYEDIQPIIAEHCWNCHDGNNDAAFALTDPDMVAQLADWLNDKINGPDDTPPYIMPPFPLDPSEECDPGLPITGDPRLTDEEKALFESWIAAGTPLGDPENAAPYTVPETREIYGDRIVEMPPLFTETVDGQEGNLYNCWSWDLGLDDGGAWLTSLQVNPDNLNIVHHAVIMADYSGLTAPNDRGDPDGDGHGQCPAPGDEVPDATMLATWAPGADPIILPEGTAMWFPQGTRLVSATHYHPNGVGQVDETSITVAWRDTPPEYMVTTLPLGAADPNENDVPNWEKRPFLLPAGDDHYHNVWRDRHNHSPDVEMRIWALFPHLHYAAKQVKVTLEHEGQDDECLLEIPQWDFDWQRTYEFDVPFEQMPLLESGDTFKIDCTYDNSESNEYLAEALADAGKDFEDIQIGNGYLDEMCVLHAIIMQEYDGRYD